jgi:transcription antitermination factor NusG
MSNDGWGLLKVRPQNQMKYLEYMVEYHPGYEFYFPRYGRVTRPAGHRRTKIVPTPVYPGYVFVQLGSELRSLLSSPIRVYFVRFTGRYGKVGRISVVQEEVINELKARERRGELVEEVVVENPYLPGRKVRVITPVASINGVLVMCTHGKTRGVVDTGLGTWDVPIHQVELV